MDGYTTTKVQELEDQLGSIRTKKNKTLLEHDIVAALNLSNKLDNDILLIQDRMVIETVIIKLIYN